MARGKAGKPRPGGDLDHMPDLTGVGAALVLHEPGVGFSGKTKGQRIHDWLHHYAFYSLDASLSHETAPSSSGRIREFLVLLRSAGFQTGLPCPTVARCPLNHPRALSRFGNRRSAKDSRMRPFIM